MSKKLGTNFVVARNTGTHDLPVWPLAANCRDVKLDLAPNMFDSSDRATTINTKIPTRYKPKLEFDALWDGGAFLTAVRAAFLAGTPLDLIVLDGTTSGQGFWAEWAVTEFPFEMPLAAGQPLKLGFQPHGNAANIPQFVNAKATTGADTVGTKKLGTNAQLHDGVNPILKIQDMKFSIKPGALFDSSDRSSVFDSVIPTRFECEIEASFLWDPADTQLAAFWTAFIINGPVTLYALDGPKATTGSWGLFGDWAIEGFPIDAPLADGQKITLKFSPHGNGANPVVVFTA